MHDILLIHSHADAEAAAHLAEAIGRVSLRQLTPWFSSDPSDSGGLRAGELWMQRLLEQLEATRIAIVLVTKNSRSEPWLFFEAGHVAARDRGVIVPVTLGIESDALPAPLSMYQGFQLSDNRSVHALLRKLLSEYKITFDGDMAQPVIQGMMTKLASTAALKGPRESSPPGHAELKEHIDRRLTILGKTLVDVLGGSSAPARTYDVRVKVRFPDLVSETYVPIRTDTTARDFLDNVYAALAGRVEPFTYLEQWVLREEQTGLILVIAEAAYFATASGLLPSDLTWIAEPIAEPFNVCEKRVPSIVGAEAVVFRR